MTTTAYTGLGAKLERNGTEIAYVTEIGGVSIKQAMIDITNQQSSNDFKEFLGGLLSVGPVSLKGVFKPGDTSGQVGLHTDLLAHTLQSWVLTYDTASATTWTFSALVAEFTILGVTIENAIEFAASLEVSGKPTLGITASGGLSGMTGVDSAAGALDFIPDFNNAVYLNSVAVATGITYVKLTLTAASHTITVTNDFDSSTQTVTSGAQSGELTLDAAATVTMITVNVKETGKAAVEYVIYITRAAA